MSVPTSPVKKFKGLNNVADSIALGHDWLTTANNINIDNAGIFSRRDGYVSGIVATLTGAFGTRNNKRLYIATDTQLQQVATNLARTTLATLTSTKPMYWLEVNEQVFYTNGVDSGIIKPDGTVLTWKLPLPAAPSLTLGGSGLLPAGLYSVAVTYLMDDGRESGATLSSPISVPANGSIVISGITSTAGAVTQVYVSLANSTVFNWLQETTLTVVNWTGGRTEVELTNAFLGSLPTAVYPALFNGAIYVAEYHPTLERSTIWRSEPLGFHLFDLEKFIPVRGEVLMLAGTTSALIIGTNLAIYAFDGSNITTLTDEYGVIRGWPNALDDKRQLFWTERGLCQAMPFQNLTDTAINVAPGVRAGGAVIEQGGNKRFVATLIKGGTAFNARTFP